jgi:hypothetical protein
MHDYRFGACVSGRWGALWTTALRNSRCGQGAFSTRTRNKHGKSQASPDAQQGDPVEQGLVMADVLEARGVAAAVTQRKAAVLVCEHALDLTDAGQLLDMLGLRPPLTVA